MEGMSIIMNEVKLCNIVVSKNKVKYDYIINGDWKKHFNIENKMEIEYSVDLSVVPQSILAIPFICNILPMIWLCDATLYVESLDKDFYDNLEYVKKGYMDMYPMFDFKGKMVIDKIEHNVLKHQNASATFFSGGVDAYTTLLRHIEEKPYLVTLWGADVKLDDVEGWNNVENHIKSVSKDYNLEYLVVKTNFRLIINEVPLSKIVEASGDNWWHAFQHGVAIIGHMAPLAYIFGFRYAYIASSYPEKMKGQYTCASDPTIDNYVRYCGCATVHDAYELDRQEKIQFLVKKKNEGNPISLRVCWISSGGKNCCRCEKCYRTILEIISEGGNPNDYNFKWDDEAINCCKQDMLNKITIEKFNIDQFYYLIQQRMLENKSKISGYEKYDWLVEMDFSKFNDYPIKIFRRTLLGRILRKICKIIRKAF